MSRIAPLVDDLLGTEDADDIMIEIMDVLGDSIASTPEVGKIYVFELSLGSISIIYVSRSGWPIISSYK